MNIQEARSIVTTASERRQSKFDAANLSPVLIECARVFVEDYSGEWPYLVSLKTQLGQKGELSPKQYAAALNSFMREIRTARTPEPSHARYAAASPINLTAVDDTPVKIPAPGFYKAVLSNNYNDYLILQLKTDWRPDKIDAGSVAVEYLQGVEWGDPWQGCAFINEDGFVQIYSRIKGTSIGTVVENAIRIIMAEPIVAAKDFAYHFRLCYKCGGQLQDGPQALIGCHKHCGGIEGVA